jgi:inosose dehydratase
MSARLASAPVTWGVWERTVDRADVVPRERLLDAVASLGYRAIELGPPGYLGGDGASVREALEPFELELVGAFVPLHLADEAAFRADLDELERTTEIVAAAGTEAVVLLADAGARERAEAAGRAERLRRTSLAGPALERAAARLLRAAERCRERGLAAALHPETGSYVEAPAEIEALLERIEPALLGLCLDTGHVLVGGGDPLRLARDWAERLSHVHLKDVDGALLRRLRDGQTTALAAWAEGLFCPFGEGEVDLAGFLALPELERFGGWLVLEQDRVGVRIDDLEAVRAVEERNLAFVTSLVAIAP